MRYALFAKPIGTSTRPKRGGELYHSDYMHISQEEHRIISERGGFIQEVEYKGVYYGTLKEDFLDKVESGLIPVSIVEPSGVTTWREACLPYGIEVVSLYIEGSKRLLVRRWLERVLEDPQNHDVDHLGYLADRLLETVGREISWGRHADYDYYISADDSDQYDWHLQNILKMGAQNLPLEDFRRLTHPSYESASVANQSVAA